MSGSRARNRSKQLLEAIKTSKQDNLQALLQADESAVHDTCTDAQLDKLVAVVSGSARCVVQNITRCWQWQSTMYGLFSLKNCNKCINDRSVHSSSQCSLHD